MQKEAKAWLIGPLATVVFLGLMGLLYDLNTVDAEIMPVVAKHEQRLELMEKISAQISATAAQNSASLKSLATSRATSSLTAGVKDKSKLEVKYGNTPQRLWSTTDTELWNIANTRIAAAETELHGE